MTGNNSGLVACVIVSMHSRRWKLDLALAKGDLGTAVWQHFFGLCLWVRSGWGEVLVEGFPHMFENERGQVSR